MKIEELRNEIDKIDGEIINLLVRRKKIARNIGEIKKKGKIPILDPSREERLLKRVLDFAVERGLNPEYVKKMYDLILTESKHEQEPDK